MPNAADLTDRYRGNNSPDVVEAIKNIAQAIALLQTQVDNLSGGGLNPDGSTVGATSQTQEFTNGVQVNEIKDPSGTIMAILDNNTLTLSSNDTEVIGSTELTLASPVFINIQTPELRLNSAPLPDSPVIVDSAFFTGGGTIEIRQGFVTVVTP